ncbi:MAG TPA: substrate-binding domain-containing protein [Planctomycetota bacterium]
MTNHSASGWVRLITLAVLLALLACFACRPAWSPDGKRLLFHSRFAEERTGIAMFDRDRGTAELLFTPHGGKTASVPLWLPDGTGAVVVWTAKDSDKQLSVTTLTFDPRGAGRSFTVRGGDHLTNSIFVPPVVVGRRLFFADKGIRRLDLDSGDVKEEDGAAGEQLVVTRRGEGVCYVSLQDGDDTRWEIGTVDPDTLQRCPIQKAPADRLWAVQPMPAFTRDLARIALPARSCEEPGNHAILVFRDGELETELPIDGNVDFGSLEWMPDGATLCASLCRFDRDEQQLKWSLLETTISGSVSRETPIVHAPLPDGDAESMGRAFPVALSPDGRIAAVSTAFIETLEEKDHGLYLVDLTHKDRRITKVPFPLATDALTLAGADGMTSFGQLCTQGYTAANPLCLTTFIGGGSTGGMSRLLRGTADLALMSRPAKPAEFEDAKKRGVTLTEHRLVTTLAVCVHKDNPVASLTIEQLARIFGGTGVRRWTELSVPMPVEFDAIVAATPQDRAASCEHFRELVLGLSRAAPTNNCLDSAADVVELVSSRQGAIGYVPLADVTGAVKIVPIAGKPGMAPCTPSPASAADGSYPLARRLFLYSRADRKPAVGAFLEWLASDAGRKVVEQTGLSPAR